MIQRYSVDDRMETMETMELMSMGGHQSSGGQTILTAAAKKQVCIQFKICISISIYWCFGAFFAIVLMLYLYFVFAGT